MKDMRSQSIQTSSALLPAERRQASKKGKKKKISKCLENLGAKSPKTNQIRGGLLPP
jgi:hypothetical protein